MSLDIIKKDIRKAIENRKEELYTLADSIYQEPELGYKEFKTAEKIRKIFEEQGVFLPGKNC